MKCVDVKKLIIFVIGIALFLGKFSNFGIANQEDQNISYEKIYNILSHKESRNEKLEQCVENLIGECERFNDFYDKQINDFTFVDDKVRLEIILSGEDVLGALKAFDENIEIESSYENLVQTLIPIDIIEQLSKENYINYIRKPIVCYPHVTSEGVGVIDADLVQNEGYYGDGVKVAVIDVGFEDYDINPEIPLERIVEAISYRSGYGIEYGGPHGSACTELVLDVAPNADLYLYSCGTISEFNSAVNRAISMNVDIVTFSAGWMGINDYDGLGMPCDIVNNARSNEILFITSSGNAAERHYEGSYTDNDGDEIHEFGSGVEVLSLGYLPSGTLVHLVLSWNDWPYSNQDYDLFLIDSYYNIVAYSINVQSGFQPPFEGIMGNTTYSDNYYVVIERWDATWNVHFELYSVYNYFETFNHPESCLTCPADANGAMTVGATYWQNDILEYYSSRGPTNDGRTKPDVVAPDGVSTYTYGGGNFYGTSASSPHTAGAAALLKSVDYSLTADDLQNKLELTALDIGSSGKDNLYGSGRINVWDAYNTINKPPVANDDYYSGAEDITINVATPGVLANDTDADNDSLTAILVNDVLNGNLILNSDGSFNYIPNENFSGNDGFTYKANDSYAYSNIATVYITINPVNDPPVANFAFNPLNPNTLDVIQFNDTSVDIDGTIVSWLWDFGGGNTSTEKNTTRQYNDSGNYTVTLNVTDDDGAANYTSNQIHVSNVGPNANFTYSPSNPSTQDLVHFTDTSNDSDGYIASWLWNFGDGYISTLQNPNHQYADNGTYPVNLTVTDDDGATNETSQQIVIKNVGPIANFTRSPPIPNDLQIVTFTDTSTDSDGNIISWWWDFGDGTTSTERHPTHQYADNGTYTVTLNVTDDDGVTDEISIEMTIANVPPAVNFTYAPSIPTVNDVVQFNDTSTDLDGTIVSWSWGFDDGNTSTSRNDTHQYSNNLIYNVTLTVTDNDGDTSSISKEIITKLTYSITLVGNETTIDLQNETDIIVTINTTASTIINISKYSGNPTGEDISGNITSIGKHVEVEVENESAVNWPINITIYYTQDDLNNSNVDESQLLGIYFWNNSIGEWQLYSDTDVNTTYNQSGYEGYCWVNAWHLTLLTPGGDNEPPSKVTGLTVTDAKDGKLDLSWDSTIDNVGVSHYKIYRDGGFLINKTTTSYQDTELTNGQPYSYQISAVDTSRNEGEKSQFKSGTPTASGGGGLPGGGDPPLDPLGPTNQKPVADVSAGEPYIGFVGEEITFNASLSSDVDGTIVIYEWDYDGDGTYDYNSTENTTTYIYNVEGEYTVILRVTDENGSTDIDETIVIISQPNRVPSAPVVNGQQEGTQNTEYAYTAVSTDEDNDTIQYHFDWGDGTTNTTEFLANGTAAKQTHSWTSAGKYTSAVQAYDNQTPSDTTRYTVLVDAYIVEGIGYITDDDADGTYDTFHDTDVETDLGQQEGKYLIDNDGDDEWDHVYNMNTGKLTEYEGEPTQPEKDYTYIIILIIIIVALIIAFGALIKTRQPPKKPERPPKKSSNKSKKQPSKKTKKKTKK